MPWDIVGSALIGPAVNSLFGSGSSGGGSSGGGSSGGGNSGGMLGSLAGGAISSYLSPPDATKAANAADPFGPQRGQYADKLSSMMNGGFTPDDPSYQWRMQQGMDAVNRGTAASGGLNSGGRLTALEQYGQGMASTEFQSQFNRLSQLSGAQSGSPAAAGQILASQQSQNGRSASAFGNAVGGAVGGIGRAIYDNFGKITGYDNSGGGTGDNGNGTGGYMDSSGGSYNNPSAYTAPSNDFNFSSFGSGL